MSTRSKKIVFIHNSAKTFVSLRLDLARELQSKGYKVAAALPVDKFDSIQTIRDASIELLECSLSRTGIGPFSNLLYFFQLLKIVKTNQFDFVFLTTFKPLLFGNLALMVARKKSARSISMITGLGYVFTHSSIKAKLIKAVMIPLLRFSLKQSTAIIFQNPDDQAFFLKYRLVDPARHNILLMKGSGVDLDRFKTSPLPKTVCILMVARLLKDKGIFEFLAAARTLKKDYPEARFKLIAPRDENPSAIHRNQIVEFENEKSLEFVPGSSDIAKEISQSSIVVLPVHYREGSPKVLAEALACGRPIITTEVPGCSQLVVDGETGFLCKPQNLPSLLDTLRKFLKNPELIHQMSAPARKFAESELDIKKIANRIVQEALESGR